MSTKHTPGPWQIEGKYRGDDGSLYLSTMHPMPVFELVPLVGKEDEHIANAHLIAAAPELYQIVKMIRSSVDSGGKNRVVSFQDIDVAEMDAALAKAEARP